MHEYKTKIRNRIKNQTRKLNGDKLLERIDNILDDFKIE